MCLCVCRRFFLLYVKREIVRKHQGHRVRLQSRGRQRVEAVEADFFVGCYPSGISIFIHRIPNAFLCTTMQNFFLLLFPAWYWINFVSFRHNLNLQISYSALCKCTTSGCIAMSNVYFVIYKVKKIHVYWMHECMGATCVTGGIGGAWGGCRRRLESSNRTTPQLRVKSCSSGFRRPGKLVPPKSTLKLHRITEKTHAYECTKWEK